MEIENPKNANGKIKKNNKKRKNTRVMDEKLVHEQITKKREQSGEHGPGGC